MGQSFERAGSQAKVIRAIRGQASLGGVMSEAIAAEALASSLIAEPLDGDVGAAQAIVDECMNRWAQVRFINGLHGEFPLLRWLSIPE